MHPQNQEHIEAAQQEADSKRENLKKEFGQEFCAKLEIVEKCCGELTRAGIPCYMFATVGDKCFQYNNYAKLFAEFGESGMITEKSWTKIKDNTKKYLESFAWTHIFQGEEPKTESDILSKLQGFCSDIFEILKVKVSK